MSSVACNAHGSGKFFKWEISRVVDSIGTSAAVHSV